MTWIKFALLLSGIYAIYYTTLISWDFLRSKNHPADEKFHVITFEEHHEPVREIPEGGTEIYDSSVLSSGGVSLKQLFNLARAEAIEFTRPVSF
jgi:hypothetical protein